MSASASSTSGTTPSPWAPLRHRLYRVIWTAQFASNVGTWMQMVGAQWLMGSLGGGPLQVALVQAALSTPIFLFSIAAGALGDVFDRRRVLLVSQSLMLVGAGGLAALTFSGSTTPTLLLALTVVVGLGQAIHVPSWQAIQPELVPRAEIPLAATLGGISMNLARAAGPAVGGVVVALAGPAWTFALNAVSFAGVLTVMSGWRRQPDERPHGPERLGTAMRRGVVYVRHSPRMRSVLVRAVLFTSCGGALWALLPVLARDSLGLNSAGYGLLLADVGLGSVLGAIAMPRLRARWSEQRLVIAASIAFMVASSVIALTAWIPATALALVLAGAGWISVLTSLNAAAQLALPGWVRSRGMAMFVLATQGGQALSAVGWGLVAQRLGAHTAFGLVAVGLVVTLPAARRWRVLPTGGVDHLDRPRPELLLPIAPPPDAGRVLVTIEYRVPLNDQEAFCDRMRPVGRIRRRTGADDWDLYHDGEDPELLVEAFVVPTWGEYLRQRGERATAGDRATIERARALASESREVTRVRRLFSAYSRS